ncbi:MAG: ABC transporter permease subunit [Actinobacteria bacterium]|nr:ABC transporter permease subunit [Actinomycetota bacterium]
MTALRARPAASPSTGPAKRRTGAPLPLALPLLVVVAGLLVWPMGTLAIRSFVGDDGGFTIQRYADVLTSARYLRSFAVTSVLAVISTLLALLLCIPAAVYLERAGTRFARTVAVAMTIPLSLPGIVIGFFVILVFGTTGVVPVAIQQMTGSRALQIAYTFSGLLLGYLYFNIPRVVLVIRGAVAGTSVEAIDAARTLGASPLRVYWSVVLPSLRPAIASATALSLATAFGAFGTAATLSRGYRVVPLDIAAAFTERFQPELAATLSLLLAIVTTTVLVGIGRLGEGKHR